MTKGRASLLAKHPFWGSLALHLALKEDPECATMWTDGKYLGYSPAFLDKLTEREVVAVLAHEVSHCAYGHMARRGNRDGSLWNEACDYAINYDLIRAGFKLPEPHLNDPKYHGMSAEEIYADLKKRGKEGQGADPGMCGEIRDAAPAHEKAKISHIDAEWKVRVRQAIAAQAAASAGNIPENLKRIFDDIKKPYVDWRDMLRRFIDSTARVEYSWSRPNKRMLGQGYIIPGMIPDGVNEIGVVVDTSGSIDKNALARFSAELGAALDTGMTKKIVVIYCDTDVKGKQEFELGDMLKLNPVGGGGTRFSPALEWFAKNEPNVSALIYFTDLECSDFGKEPWVPLMWLGYGRTPNLKRLAANVPFGETVFLAD
jgi:predicted metal-dependent peptidase